MRERAGSPFALSRPQKHSSGPFRQQKEPVCVCVSLGEISRERRVRDFPAGDFIRFLVTRSAIERRRRQWDRMIMSFVYIYGNPLRASERAPAERSVCNRRVSCVRQKACHFSVSPFWMSCVQHTVTAGGATAP